MDSDIDILVDFDKPIDQIRLSYNELNVREGQTAAAEWLRMIQSADDNEKSLIRKNLLEYCRVDTYAEARILKEIKMGK